MMNTKLYNEHLARVSRSFAFCIEQLDPAERHRIGLAYILCRLLDTVEDSVWPSTSDQTQAFEAFNDFLATPNDSVTIEQWTDTFPRSIPEGEILLLEDAPIFFEDLHKLPEQLKLNFQRTIKDMSRGMEYFCTHKKQEADLSLHSMEEVNQYCFFVAGIVGELLTDIVRFAEPNYEVPPQQYLNAFHFGLYLQKINILKDQLGDQAEGRNFIHSRDEVRRSLNTNVRHAFAYLKALPTSQKKFRIFCSWSLFLGLASLPHIDRSWETKEKHKISRLETVQLLMKLRLLANNNEALEEMFEHYLRKCSLADPLNATLSIPGKEGVTLWFQKIYAGRLGKTGFRALNMIPS